MDASKKEENKIIDEFLAWCSLYGKEEENRVMDEFLTWCSRKYYVDGNHSGQESTRSMCQEFNRGTHEPEHEPERGVRQDEGGDRKARAIEVLADTIPNAAGDLMSPAYSPPGIICDISRVEKYEIP